MASRRVKRSEIWGWGLVVTDIWGTFDLSLFKVILGVIRCTCFKMACNSKTPGRTAKRSEIWELMVVFICIFGTFNLLVFSVILGSFRALVSKWHVTRKWLAVEPNGVKFGRQGCVCMYMGYLWPVSVQCHFGAIRCTCLKVCLVHRWENCPSVCTHVCMFIWI